MLSPVTAAAAVTSVSIAEHQKIANHVSDRRTRDLCEMHVVVVRVPKSSLLSRKRYKSDFLYNQIWHALPVPACLPVCACVSWSQQSCFERNYVRLYVVCRIYTLFAMRQTFDIGCFDAVESFVVTFCIVGFSFLFFSIRLCRQIISTSLRTEKHSNAKIKFANLIGWAILKCRFHSVYSRFCGARPCKWSIARKPTFFKSNQ